MTIFFFASIYLLSLICLWSIPCFDRPRIVFKMAHWTVCTDRDTPPLHIIHFLTALKTIYNCKCGRTTNFESTYFNWIVHTHTHTHISYSWIEVIREPTLIYFVLEFVISRAAMFRNSILNRSLSHSLFNTGTRTSRYNSMLLLFVFNWLHADVHVSEKQIVTRPHKQIHIYIGRERETETESSRYIEYNSIECSMCKCIFDVLCGKQIELYWLIYSQSNTQPYTKDVEMCATERWWIESNHPSDNCEKFLVDTMFTFNTIASKCKTNSNRFDYTDD